MIDQSTTFVNAEARSDDPWHVTIASTALQDRIATLRRQVSGRVIAPGDPDYDTARAVMYGGIDRRPAAAIRVAGVEDIRALVAAARETGAELAIRSGGHSAKSPRTARWSRPTPDEPRPVLGNRLNQNIAPA